MRIRTKFLIVFLLTSLIPIFFLTYNNFNFSRKALIKDTQDKLEIITTFQTTRLHRIATTYQAQITAIASRPLLLQLLNTFNSTHNKTVQEQLNNYLQELQQTASNAETISLRDINGEIIASTNTALIGTNQPGTLLPIDFIQGKNHTTQILFRKPIFNKAVNIGEIELVIKNDVITSITGDFTGLGKTGELIAVRREKNGKIISISPRRFEKLATNQSLLMNEALQKKQNFFPEITDYRGKSVVAITKYLSDLDWGVIVKIDRDEAFQAVNSLRDSILLFTFILTLVIIIITLFFVYSISGPIINLVSVAKFVHKGDLSKRALILSNDEIGELSTSFNSMLDSLQESHADLEKKVKERTQQLENSNKDLESFSYSVSHDLRAPLRAIDGFSQILEEDYMTKLDDDGKRVITTIRTSTKQMATLIDDLLTFSRLGRKPLETQNVDMTQLARSVFDELKLINPNRNISFLCDNLPPAHVDPTLIRQVWINLLSNAIKYTKKKENATISVSSTTTADGVTYLVKDNGAGFDMKYKDKLFGVFQRLHSSEDFEGTGVGLAIISRIITKHGGRVFAEGVVGEGATFGFILPKTNNG